MYLLDTNVVSEVRKKAPDPRVEAWLDGVPGPSLHVSALVLGELRHGVEKLRGRDPDQAAVHDRWLAQVRAEFADRIVPVTPGIAEEWGRLLARRPLPLVDGLLAATAAHLRWVLVTRNVKDFAGLPVEVVDPFAF